VLGDAPSPTSQVHYPGALPGRCVGRILHTSIIVYILRELVGSSCSNWLSVLENLNTEREQHKMYFHLGQLEQHNPHQTHTSNPLELRQGSVTALLLLPDYV